MGAGVEEEEWVDVKEEQDEWDEWDGWEPEPSHPYGPQDPEDQPGEGSSSSHAEPLPPPPPPPGVPEPNPKSLSWDYSNANDWNWGETWGRGWTNQSWKWKGRDKGWHEPWKPHQKNQTKAPWAKRKRTADGQYVKGGFQDHDGNFWQCLVLSSFLFMVVGKGCNIQSFTRVGGPPWI